MRKKRDSIWLPRMKVGLGKPINYMKSGYKLEIDGTYWILKPKKRKKEKRRK